MSLKELRDLCNLKKNMYWKLKKEEDSVSNHFKGTHNALRSIEVYYFILSN